MKNEEFYQLWHSTSQKFNYGLISLTFATLALSFQFSPKMGNAWPWILILAWVCFGLSAYFGGERLVKEVSHMKINYHAITLRSSIDVIKGHLRDPAFILRLQAGQVFNTDNVRQTEVTYQALLVSEQDLLAVAEMNMGKASKNLPLFFQLQYWLLLAGLVANGVFVSRNFLLGPLT